MNLRHEYRMATGTGIDDCHWLGYRFEGKHGFSPECGESWLGQAAFGDDYDLLIQHGWFTDLWRTDSGVWVSEIRGRVHMNPSIELKKAPWQMFELDASLSGIWGLRDDLVFSWGMRGSGSVAFFFDGTRWREVAVPGHVAAVHGVNDDLIYAVGLDGLIARWDGSGFRALDKASDGNLCGVFVVSTDEMYACGLDGDLLTGSVHGWRKLLSVDSGLHCVARWNDELWVGAGEEGLFKLTTDLLEPVKPNVFAERLDARERLLITAPNVIAETSDGVDFVGTVVTAFEELAEYLPPSWRG